MSPVTAEGVVTSVVSSLRLAGHEGMEKNTETTIMGYIRTTIRIHSSIPSQPKAISMVRAITCVVCCTHG